MTKSNFVGSKVTIKAGTRVHREGKPAIQKRTSRVTVHSQETTPTGKTRIVWQSLGYRASTILS
jgi:hypothetical protein